MSDEKKPKTFYGDMLLKADRVMKGVEGLLSPRERMLYLQGATFGFASGAELLNAALLADDGKDSPGVVIEFLKDGDRVSKALVQVLAETEAMINLPATATKH